MSIEREIVVNFQRAMEEGNFEQVERASNLLKKFLIEVERGFIDYGIPNFLLEKRWLRIPKIFYDPAERDFCIDPDHPVKFSPKENEVFYYLYQNQAFPQKIEEIAQKLEGGPISPNNAAVLIRRLREKIEPEPASPRILTTIKNQGYFLFAEIQIVRS